MCILFWNDHNFFNVNGVGQHFARRKVVKSEQIIPLIRMPCDQIWAIKMSNETCGTT